MSVRFCLAALLFLALWGASGAKAEWRTLSLPEEGVSIELPGEPHERAKNDDPEMFAAVTEHGAELGAGFLILATFWLVPEQRAKMDDWAILDFGMGLVRDGCHRVAASERLGGPGPGSEARYECQEGLVLRTRFYVVGDRLYRLVAGGPPQIVESDDATRFLGSLKLRAE